MKITILGSGTSAGVPVIACPCAVCTSNNPKNKRLRPSIFIDLENNSNSNRYILIDTGQDFREQALKFKIPKVDMIFYTHSHADHIFGLDDIRIYNFIQKCQIPIYCNKDTANDLERIFDYCFNKDENYEGGGIPDLKLCKITSGEKIEFGTEFLIPVKIFHGKKEILGLRVKDFAYLTDCNKVSEESLNLLNGINTLVISGLRYRPHCTHFTIDEAVEFSKQTTAKKVFLTHISHEVDHEEGIKKLSLIKDMEVSLAFDGQIINL